ETNPLQKIIQASYQALNYTNPNMTSACWLCYDDKPPFYEAIGLDLSYSLNNERAPKQCKWEEKRVKIPMQNVKGKGRCIG
ncbi:ENV2 protein, partial [Sclerurus mexicanus]|nr:ENV2 protein [Sclerurus mexicanus]